MSKEAIIYATNLDVVAIISKGAHQIYPGVTLVIMAMLFPILWEQGLFIPLWVLR